MSYVWTCTDFDSDTQTCFAEGWVQVSTWLDYMPTVEEAIIVGSAMFFGICIVLAVTLLAPPPNTDHD